jgi:hypothetical protein
MEPTSPRRPTRRSTYRLFCLDCDDLAHNLDNAGYPTNERNVLERMSDVRGVAFDHVRFAANTCTHQNFLVELTRSNGRTSETRHGIFDGRFVRVDV